MRFQTAPPSGPPRPWAPRPSRFQVEREVRHHAMTHHPHVVALHAAFEDGENAYLVQEYAGGRVLLGARVCVRALTCARVRASMCFVCGAGVLCVAWQPAVSICAFLFAFVCRQRGGVRKVTWRRVLATRRPGPRGGGRDTSYSFP